MQRKLKEIKKATISENTVKLIIHIFFLIIALSVVIGITLHYFKGTINSEWLESRIYFKDIEKCLSLQKGNRTYYGIIDQEKIDTFQDCFYLGEASYTKNIVFLKVKITYPLNEPKETITIYNNQNSFESLYSRILKKEEVEKTRGSNQITNYQMNSLTKPVVYKNQTTETNALLNITLIFVK